MQKNNTDCNPTILLLARRADSLCSVIPSWAMVHRWADLILCHSPYELLVRRADLPPHQSAILIARSVMFTNPVIRTVLQSYPSMCLIAWTTPEQAATDHKSFIAANLPVATVSSTDELSNLINILNPTVNRQTPAIDASVTAANFDPKAYKLSNDELNALLGTAQ